MSLEVLDRIRQEELKGEEEKSKAQLEAKNIVADGLKATKKAVAEMEKDTEKKVALVVEQGKLRADEIIQSEKRKTEKECEELKVNAREGTNEAVKYCVERILSQWQ